MGRPRQILYWRFALPLLFLLPAKTSGRLIQNAVLLVQPDGVRELVAFAIAAALFQTFGNCLGMAAQLTTVWAEDRRGYRQVRRCLVGLALGAAALLALVALLPPTRAAIGSVYRLGDDLVAAVATYLACFAVVLPIQALLKVCEGVVLRGQRSGVVTGIKIAEIALVAGILAVASWWALPVRWAIVASVIVPEIVILPIMWWLHRRSLRPLAEASADPRPTRQLWRMYAPMAVTTMLFTVSRPLIFAIITATYGPGRRSEELIAAATLAFTTGFLFQGQINALRQVLVTFREHPRTDLRRFVIALAAVVTAAMVLFVTTPAATWFLAVVQQADGRVLHMASEALWLMVLAIPLIAWRNWFHGLGMANRRTGAMAIGGLGRNAAAGLVAGGAALLGLLDHYAAMLAMVAAFACEALTTAWCSRGWRRHLLETHADGRLAT